MTTPGYPGRPMPQYRFPGLVPGDRWCVTAANWLRAHQEGVAAPVVLASTHERALDIVPLARRKAERVKAEQRAKDALAEIDSIGVQVKDISIGLLDFPCEVDGQIILLCWKLGEKTITHWHGTQEGFAGRKPINERIARARKVN